AGLISADHQHGWKLGNEYTYLVRSRTMANLGELSDQQVGLVMKGLLTVQAKDPQTLAAKLWKAEYARIQSSLSEGWDSEISDQMLELRDLPISGKPFEIKLKDGLITDLIVDRNTPTWEVNILKSIVSQLQVDTKGEDAFMTNDKQLPTEELPYGNFRKMEDSVGGKCEVRYDLMPLSEHLAREKPELVPLPKLRNNGILLEIVKTKNFDNCDQRMSYHFGNTANWEASSNEDGKSLSKSSTSRVILSGSLRSFTVQSSTTTSKLLVGPRFYDEKNGMLASRMNLTLADMKETKNPLSSPSNPESTGNLVYVYSNPFSDIEERRIGKQDWNKQLVSDSVSSVSSSEEATNKQNLRSLSSSSSSSSSSISSSEEKNTYWQPKPTLKDAPQNPLLPLFIGYKGKHIGRSNQLDIVSNSKELISQIAIELEDPSNIPNQETLEKFTILCSLNAWSLWKDAVTQAGTGPALLAIKHWIENKEIQNWEAMDILSRLPKTARTPTDQYIRELFKLTTNELVNEDKLLKSAAIVALSELIHNAQVNKKTIHNNYPVHTFGRLTSKHDRSVQDEWIPHLSRELKKAVENKDSVMIQTMIVALGKIGDPKILSVFEPYLEGKQPITTFQRTMIVAALSKLAETHPKLARSVLYKLYLNTMEHHDLRCTAVFLLMKTDPPISMLQRMAEFTNIDTNKHVNSAVKSTLDNIAKLQNPKWENMAKKARTVQSLLATNDHSIRFSRGFTSNLINDEKNIVIQTILNYIGSDDGLIPKAVYYATYSTFGDFKLPPTEIIAMISNVRSLMDLVLKDKQDEANLKLAAEKIAEELNILADEPTPLEGNVMWDVKYITRFLPFNKDTLQMLPMVMAKLMLSLREGKFINLNRLESYDVALSLPTETGLPFVHTFKIPVLHKLTGNAQGEMKAGRSIAMKNSFRFVHAKKIQGRIGFVTPFDHQQFMAGIDLNFQMFAPLKFSLNLNTPKRNMEMKFWPMKGEEKARVLHYSVVPFTAIHDVLNLRPLLTEKTTQIIRPENLRSVTLPDSDPNSKIKVNVEAVTNDVLFDLKNLDIDKWINMILNPWSMDNDNFRNVNVFVNLKRDLVDPIVLNLSTERLELSSNNDDALWTSKVLAIEPSDKESRSEARKKQLLIEAAKGIKSAISSVLDIHLHIPDEVKTTLTIATANSNVEKAGRTLLYLRNSIDRNDKTPSTVELCAAAQAKVTPNEMPFINQAIQTKPKVDLDMDLRVGSTCSEGEQIAINGKAIQTKTLSDMVKKSALMKECQKQMEQGNNMLNACQKAAAFSMVFNALDLSVNFQSDVAVTLITELLNNLRNTNFMNIHSDLKTLKNASKRKLDFRLDLANDLKKFDLSIHSPVMDLRLNDIDLSALGISANDILMAVDDAMDLQSVWYNEDEPSCVMDRTKTQTFDGKEYPMRLGNCWHVLMTTYPQLNPENSEEKLRIPKDSNVAILVRDRENDQKEVKVLLGNTKIQFVPTSNLPIVNVNEQTVSVTDDQTYQERQDDKVLFEIFKLNDNSLELISDRYDINLITDGSRLLIKASDKYRNAVRGLCGNFDNEAINDLTGPRSCSFRKLEQFVASYALTKHQCEGESLEIARSLLNHECVRETNNIHTNVISDIESGRQTYEKGNLDSQQSGEKRCSILKTHTKELDNKLCFSMRPVLSCAPGCISNETKSKTYEFHCMERNPASLNLKKRIEKGRAAISVLNTYKLLNAEGRKPLHVSHGFLVLPVHSVQPSLHLLRVEDSLPDPVATPGRLDPRGHFVITILPHLTDAAHQISIDRDPGTMAAPVTLDDDGALVQQPEMVSSENAADPGLHCRAEIQLKGRGVRRIVSRLSFHRMNEQWRMRVQREKSTIRIAFGPIFPGCYSKTSKYVGFMEQSVHLSEPFHSHGPWLISVFFPFWEQGINCYVFHVCGESFVQPKIVPPFHGNQIAKPHVCQFMGHSQADSSHIGARTVVFAMKQLCFTECDETPVFHGARREIRYTDQI
ncbi:Vitellogenin, partial [Melipona quadrifasciata]